MLQINGMIRSMGSGMYKLRKRTGRKVEISYDNGPWKSTGCDTVQEAEDKLGLGGLEIFGNYARDFYTRRDENSIWYMKNQRGRTAERHTLQTKQKRLETAVMPYFGKKKLVDIKARDIDRWFIRELKQENGLPYAPQTKNDILTVLREILDQAMLDGLVQSNEARKVKTFAKVIKDKGTLSDKEIDILFPEDDEKLIETFGSVVMACYFRIFLDTGFRPCEIMALRFSDIREDGSVYTEYMFDQHENKVMHKIKTSKTGKRYRVGTLSPQSLRLVSRLQGQYIILDNMPMDTHHYINRTFKRVVKEKLGRTDLTQYRMRHAFASRSSVKYPKEVVMELMGHTTWEATYDLRTPDQIMDTVRTELSRYQE